MREGDVMRDRPNDIHRTLTEQRLGRKLGPNEVVDHADEDKTNNGVTREERLKLIETIKGLTMNVSGLLGSTIICALASTAINNTAAEHIKAIFII